MPSFGGIADNRWRPDFESGQRRVQEELAEGPVRYSRELSFVPAQTRRRLDAYDAQTRAMIEQRCQLEHLQDGPEVLALLDEWQWVDQMQTPDTKQLFLEERIEQVQRDPEENRHLLVFLLIAFEPVRRSVSRAFVDLHSGLTPEQRDVKWSNREEARLIRHIAREELYDVTREGALEAIYRYPLKERPPRFFLWLRETIAQRALDKLRGDLPAAETTGACRAAAEAMQRELGGFDQLERPPMRERAGLREWRQQVVMRDVFDVVGEFFQHDPVRDACRAAVGRLPKAQREVIDGYFYVEVEVPDLAVVRDVSESTIYNQKSQAQRAMANDDVFFSKLYVLQEVRDHARAAHLRKTYPDGRMPDGRRLVIIEDEAA